MTNELISEHVYPYQLVNAFVALDRELSNEDTIMTILVSPMGYSAYWAVGISDEQDRRISEAIGVVAAELNLPEDWPKYLITLFPPEVSQSTPAPEIVGEALTITQASPDQVLLDQLFSANVDKANLPASMDQLARAAGCNTATEVKSLYEEAFDSEDFPLSEQSLEELEHLMA